MTNFEGVDRIIIINLKERTDRRAMMDRQLDRLGLGDDRRISYFNAIRTDNFGPLNSLGAHGIYLSYLNVLRQNAELQGKILVLEDDCQFNWRLKRDSFAHDSDFIYGGILMSENQSRKSFNPQTSSLHGAHCIAHSARVRKPLIKFLEENLKSIPDGQEYIAPIDGQIVDFWRSNPEYSVRFERVAFQSPSESDITPKAGIFQKSSLSKRLARSVKRKIQYYTS